MNDNKELVSARFQEFFKVAKLITDTEFLLKLRLMEIGDRNVMKQVLEFLVKHINFEVRITEHRFWVICLRATLPNPASSRTLHNIYVFRKATNTY